jgi:hypothetical protein
MRAVGNGWALIDGRPSKTVEVNELSVAFAAKPTPILQLLGV